MDLDGDGHLDLVYRHSMKWYVEKGRGDGTFGDTRVIDVPMNASLRSVVDLDGDAYPDLVMTVVEQGRVNLLVARNDGGGHFGPPETYPEVFPSPISELAFADLDGDGRLDLLARASSEVLVARNLGGSFGDVATYGLGVFNDSGRLVVGDVTGDGRPDVIVTHRVSSVSVLAATADGTLAPRATYDIPSHADGIALGDFDEDGLLDVVVGTIYDQRPSVSVLLNQGAGVLGPAASFEASHRNGSQPSSVVVADVNGDGHLDVGSTSEVNGHVAVLLGTGTGQLEDLTILDIDQASLSMTFSDLDRDGRPDLLLANVRSLTIHLNSGTSSLFEMRWRHELGPYVTASRVHVTALDGDEHLDTIEIGGDLQQDPRQLILTRLGTATGALGSVFWRGEPAVRPQHSLLADLNNDSRQDLLILGTEGSITGIQAMMNNGDGTLSAAAALTFSYAEMAKKMSIGDLDGDGRRDLVVVTQDERNDNSTLHYFRGKGDGTFGESRVIWTGRYAGGMAILDITGDGKLDVVVDHVVFDPHANYRQDILPGHGDGTFGPAVQTALSRPSTFMAVRDLDRDGSADLIRFQGDQIATSLGGANGTAGPRSTPSRELSSAEFGDVDGDGHLDLVSRIDVVVVAVYLGRGDGTFREPLYYDAGWSDPLSFSLGDIDRDGRVDIVVTNRFASAIGNQFGVVSVLHGRCL